MVFVNDIHQSTDLELLIASNKLQFANWNMHSKLHGFISNISCNQGRIRGTAPPGKKVELVVTRPETYRYRRMSRPHESQNAGLFKY